jgi:hypothetical protein
MMSTLMTKIDTHSGKAFLCTFSIETNLPLCHILHLVQWKASLKYTLPMLSKSYAPKFIYRGNQISKTCYASNFTTARHF